MDRDDVNAASVALIEGGRVLLIERARPPYRGLWTLPGGRREAGETAEQCAIREVGEELGVTPRTLVPVLTERFGGPAGADWHLAVFAAAGFDGTIVPSDEVAGIAWVAPDAMGRLRTTPGLRETLERALRAVAGA
jgi:8-oxo-dGTP diphosphatase